MEPEITIEVVGADRLPELHRLRRRVFGDERSVDESFDLDGRDEAATQVAAYADGLLIGTGRLLVDGPVGRVGRMAVDAVVRGAGVGARILRRLEIEARHRGAQQIELHAMSPAYSFYRRAGYVSEGGETTIVGHPHLLMRKRLPVLRPARDSDAAALIELIGGCFAEYDGCVLDVDGEEPWLRSPATSYAGMGGAIWVFTDGLDGPAIASGAGRPSTDGRDEIKSMYVSAAARRLGLARDLVRQVEAWSDARGRTTHLWTDSRFVDAHRLYESLGYVADGRQRDLHDLSHTTEYHYLKKPAVG